MKCLLSSQCTLFTKCSFATTYILSYICSRNNNESTHNISSLNYPELWFSNIHCLRTHLYTWEHLWIYIRTFGVKSITVVFSVMDLTYRYTCSVAVCVCFWLCMCLEITWYKSLSEPIYRVINYFKLGYPRKQVTLLMHNEWVLDGAEFVT